MQGCSTLTSQLFRRFLSLEASALLWISFQSNSKTFFNNTLTAASVARVAFTE
jgi:hypothetical protein